ncbi:MAG: hypothetical protein Q9M28_10920, partial [Mariprofundaceae bacterium]|nr:hypothetical protein [Mariprofundaceae bacterium]
QMNLFKNLYIAITGLFSTKQADITSYHLPNDNHIARYLRPSDVEDETVLSTAFQYKKNKEDGSLKENELSVNWLEYFNRKGVKSILSSQFYQVKGVGVLMLNCAHWLLC